VPEVRVKRTIGAPPEDIWRIAADPAHLPRWWPRTVRVGGLSGSGRRARWTQVLEARSGAAVRADYRCTESTEGSRVVWEQQIDGTPFEKVLRSAEIELRIEPADEGRSDVELRARQALRGLSRLGAPMMKSAWRKTLAGALTGLAQAFDQASATPA
jgi:uncharacterized protein YndB with AHSA1/START domain